MNQDVRSLVQIFAETFPLPEPIWEIGSYCVPGQEELANLRRLFPGREYLGLDMRPGPGVDRIENVERMTAADGSAGTILCLNTFEHVRDIFAGARELHRVLAPGGVLIMSCPFDFPIHDHPGDYWRFTPQALEVLTSGFPTRLLGFQGYPEQPHNVFVVAFKADAGALVAAKLPELRQKALGAVRRKGLHLDRRIKLALARRLAGKRFFRTFDGYDHLEMWLAKSGN